MIGFIGASLQLLLVKINAALSLIYTFSSSPLHTHYESQSPLVVSWQRISTQKLSLQISMKSSCNFFFNDLGMPTQFSNSNSPFSVLHGPNLYSTNVLNLFPLVSVTALNNGYSFAVFSLSVSWQRVLTHELQQSRSRYHCITAHIKSSNYTLSLHRLTSTTNFPWLSLTAKWTVIPLYAIVFPVSWRCWTPSSNSLLIVQLTALVI
jgi:hypothetical protein